MNLELIHIYIWNLKNIYEESIYFFVEFPKKKLKLEKSHMINEEKICKKNLSKKSKKLVTKLQDYYLIGKQT